MSYRAVTQQPPRRETPSQDSGTPARMLGCTLFLTEQPPALGCYWTPPTSSQRAPKSQDAIFWGVMTHERSTLPMQHSTFGMLLYRSSVVLISTSYTTLKLSDILDFALEILTVSSQSAPLTLWYQGVWKYHYISNRQARMLFRDIFFPNPFGTWRI